MITVFYVNKRRMVLLYIVSRSCLVFSFLFVWTKYFSSIEEIWSDTSKGHLFEKNIEMNKEPTTHE